LRRFDEIHICGEGLSVVLHLNKCWIAPLHFDRGIVDLPEDFGGRAIGDEVDEVVILKCIESTERSCALDNRYQVRVVCAERVGRGDAWIGWKRVVCTNVAEDSSRSRIVGGSTAEGV
jgi:hypothetical protein